MNQILIILIIATIGPIIGSLVGILKKPNDLFMSCLLSFAAGVMLSVAFLELIPEGLRMANEWICISGIIIGTLVMFAFDRLLPHLHPALCSQEQGRNLQRTALFLLVGIGLHNLPEGMAIAIGTVTESRTGFTIALAIAFHHIPEGICTAAPFFYHSQKRFKSFLVSSATSIPVVIGFIIAYFLYKIIPVQVVGLIISATAGLMIYICADELIPSSSGKENNHQTIFYLIGGIIFVVLLNLIK